jgi:DNA phosphorothioation-dependent restriction protein DptH
VIRAEHLSCLSGALSDLLGEPTRGTVAFLRCLSSEQVDALIDAPEFEVPGWSTFAVVDKGGTRRLTAGQAVERREDKGDAVLFLIDPLRAGAGLDGIYSAAHEISATELFKCARLRARKALPDKAFLNTAIRRAERLGRRRRLTPWQDFDFHICVRADGPGVGIARLGLWPIASEGTPDDAQLDLSAAVADRLLFSQDTRGLGDRIRALLLDDPTGEIAAALERFLRGLVDLSPLASALAVVRRPDLWLGPLRPRFSGQALRMLRVSPWHDAKSVLLKWSGLIAPEETGGKPRLLLDQAAAAKDQSSLVVRWTTEPDDLKKGSVEYRLTVIAGEEELAERIVAHRERQPQQAVFSLEDFDELDTNSKFEAFVQVTALGADDVESQRTEEFQLEFGKAPERAAAGSGRIERTLVDGAISFASRTDYDEAIAEGHMPPRTTEDKKGYIIWTGDRGRSVRVRRPALIRQVEEDWVRQQGAPGRWTQSVRADGSPVGPPMFIALEPGSCNASIWDRVKDASRRLSADLGPFGLLARVQGPRWRAGDDYVNSWIAALESGAPELALHGTVEVKSLSGRPIGVIATPLHPLRLAWHALYDIATAHARYEEGMLAPAVHKAMKSIDSAHFPATLPGAGESRGYVFGDVLGFNAVAMTVDGEPEPKAAVALLSVCLGGGSESVGPSIGAQSASLIAREIRHYLDCQVGAGGERLDLLSLQAWRPGDGATVARALGLVLRGMRGPEEDEDEDTPLCFTLELHHPSASGASGRFLADVGRRRRSGGGLLEVEDRWMTETAPRPGGIMMPRLRWAKRDEKAEPQASHLSIAFDVFEARLEPRLAASLGEARPLQGFGLIKVMERHVQLDGDLEWTVFAPPTFTGEKAPDNRVATDRLLRLDAAVAKATVRSLGGSESDWPALVTRLPETGQLWIDRLHERSDWVVTVDRNACLEYFDAPQRLPSVYERFVIDAVPERTDLGALQLVTSSSNLDAVRDLVDRALGDMGLSSSERNSRFLIGQLKALSGRLAIRLANAAGRTEELVALALMQANCAEDGSADGPWLDLSQSFLVPVDEIADAAPVAAGYLDDAEGGRRADFIHVRVQGRGSLEFRFVEVKHRLHLRTARQAELLSRMLRQTSDLRRRWMSWFFGSDLKPVERAIRMSQLARILHFYAARASRHRLTAKAYERLKDEIDQLLLKEDYSPGEVEKPDIGYIFCPEQRSYRPEPLYAPDGEHGSLWLFGPGLLPEERTVAPLKESYQQSDDQPRKVITEDTKNALSPLINAPSEASETGNGEAAENTANAKETLPLATDHESVPKIAVDPIDIVLGTAAGGSQEIEWRLSIKANPHLLMVGLPGMGKTTCLINICRQLAKAAITPIVFSYHDDIDEKLARVIGPLNLVDYDGLGFNPLRIDSDKPRAHIDVAGTLRDIFGSIFGDLGDLQLEELRQAIKQSYDDLGWDSDGAPAARATPPFRAFFDILNAKHKPNQNLLARLRELADYGFFDGAGERASLLRECRASIIRVHGTTNGMLQNAFSSFVLYSIYKDMFRRGVQAGLTHAIIFDEAHRAARLKLIPQLAKECRKFGLALALASQEAKDFNPALFSAVGNYLILRVTEMDARILARMAGSSDQERRIADRLKGLERYTGLFFGEGRSRPTTISLQDDSTIGMTTRLSA